MAPTILQVEENGNGVCESDIVENLKELLKELLAHDTIWWLLKKL